MEGKRNEEKEGEIGGVRREIRRNEMDKKNEITIRNEWEEG